MKLTMTAIARSSLRPEINEENVIQYQVHGLAAGDAATILSKKTAQGGTTWAITRNGERAGQYATAQEALKSLEAESFT